MINYPDNQKTETETKAGIIVLLRNGHLLFAVVQKSRRKSIEFIAMQEESVNYPINKTVYPGLVISKNTNMRFRGRSIQNGKKEKEKSIFIKSF